MDSDIEFVIIVSIPDYSPRCYGLEGDHVKIGRGRNNHLTLDNPSISSSHCEFVKDVDGGTWKFRDLGSTNGSKRNGKVVNSDPVAVGDGDQIYLGEEIKIQFCKVREIEAVVSEDDDGSLDVNPVAAAVARQVREDQEGGRTVRLRESDA